jgi:hypothetical protein
VPTPIQFTPIDFSPEPTSPGRDVPSDVRSGKTANTPTSIQFTPIEFTPEAGAGVPSSRSDTRTAVQREVADREFLNRPALSPERMSDAEIAEIAKRHGVDPAELRKLAPYFGARTGNVPANEDRIVSSDAFSADEWKRAAGGVASAVGLGIPQKLYKQYQGNPAMERALDEVQNLASGRQSLLGLGGDVIAPGGAGSKLAKTALGKIGLAVGTGAVAGAANSGQGHELEGAALGAGLGLATGGIAARAGAKATAGATDAEKGIIEAVVKREGPELDKGAAEILAQRADSEKAITDHILRPGETELTQETASKIVREQLDPETVERVMDMGTEEGHLARVRVIRTEEGRDLVRELGMEKALERQLAEEVIETRAAALAQDLQGAAEPLTSGKNARSVIEEWAARQGGEEALAKRVQLLAEENAAQKYINDNAIRGVGRAAGVQDKLNAMSDAQFVLRDIDERLGTSTESVHRDLNAAINKMSYERQAFRGDLDRIFRNTDRATDAVITDTDKLYRALDTGDMSGLTPGEVKAAEQFTNYFRRGLNFVNQVAKEKGITPLSIPARTNYVPHAVRPLEELASEIGKRVTAAEAAAGGNLTRVGRKQFAALSAQSDPVRELTQAVEVLTGTAPDTGAKLLTALREMTETGEGRARIQSMARSTLERTGKLPDWMREKNLYKLADRWASQTLKHVYLRESLDKLRSIATRLEKAGAVVESKYVRNLLGDIQGVRASTVAERTLAGKVAWFRQMDQLGDSGKPGAEAVAAFGKAIPELLNDLNRQIYPNLLGLSPRAVIMNATQTFAKTAPELGGAYGYGSIVRGAAYAVKNWRHMSRILAEQGLAPSEFTSKYRQAVQDGIQRSSLYAIPREVLQKAGDAAMYFYTKMDTINRSIAYGAAQVMAHDLSRGSAAAARSLRRFPRTVQEQVARAGNTDEIGKVIASHLNASTQYNYNRASMSEFGRVMGPLFSTFSKWPTATAGEILSEYRTKGVLRASTRTAEKFVAPFLLFTAADYLMRRDNDGEATDRQQVLFGKGGLASSAPIGSVGAIVRGDFFTPPAVDAVLQGTLIPALQGNGAKLSRGLSSAIQNFTPGSVYVRFLTDDLPTLVTGRRPEGSTFIERTANQVGKKLR